MNFRRIAKLCELVDERLKRKTIIILPREKIYRITGVDDIQIAMDEDEWEITPELEAFANETAHNGENTEKNILQIYEKICRDYVYDDNVLSYVRKNDDDTFFLPDNYGRDTDSNWRQNREKHNRRVCFEISRILAKSLEILFEEKGVASNYDTCIIWDDAVTHYLVGLSSNDYYLMLDTDDFTKIKDMTRIKAGLTLDGIDILEESDGRFEAELNEYNKTRIASAKEQIEMGYESTVESTQLEEYDIEFFRAAVQILVEKYHIDSAGIYEYMKEIADTRLGPKYRKKMWTAVENNPGIGERYTRCLMIDIGEDTYVVDVTKDKPEDIFRKLSEEDQGKFISFSSMMSKRASMGWDDPYDGR